MKILTIIPYYISWGGPAQVVRQVGLRLMKMGHDVTIMTTDAGPDTRRAVIPKYDEGLKIYAFPNLSPTWARTRRAFFPPGYFFQIKNAVRESDLVHIIEYRHLLGYAAAKAAIKEGVPTLLSPHGSLPNALQRMQIKQVFDFFFGLKTLKRIDHFHALTEIEQNVIGSSGIDKKNITLIPNGVDLPNLGEVKNRVEAKARFGISPDRFTILFMARLHPDKGLNQLLRVCEALVKEGRKPALLVAGPDDGGLEEALKYVQSRDMEPWVQFTGYLEGEEKKDAFTASDLYCLLSSYETMPITVLEALSYGRAVLVSDKAAVSGIHDEHAGLVVPYDDEQAAFKELIELMDAPERLKEMEKNARELAEKKFSWDRIVTCYEQLFQTLAFG